jgi:hypothetical protein
MKLQKLPLAQCLLLGLLSLAGLAAGCKDDDPCDPEQLEQDGQCYPVPVSAGGSSSGAAGAADGGADEGDAAVTTAGAPSGGLDTPVGTPCEDTTASSDCGGDAPVCADLTPLGQSIMCTQIDCATGETNEAACPSGFTCFAVPGYPSVCIAG